jgi:MFS transporter, FSR family, fosmidomycin resistance protein
MTGNRRVLFANSIYHLTNDGAVTVLAGQITVLQAVFSFGPLEAGLLSGAALLTTAIFQVIFGAMSDRREATRFLPIGIIILGVGSAFVAQSSTFWMLLALVSLSRIGASFYHPVGIAWIGRVFRGHELDRSMGFQSAFGDSGVILGMATTSIIAVAFNWSVPFLLWGGINLAAVAIGLTLVRNYRAPVPDSTPPTRDYRAMLRDVRLWLFPLALGGAAFSIFSTFGPLLLLHKFGFGRTDSEVALAAWILTGAFVAFFFGRVSRRFGRFRILTVSFAFIATASLVAGLSADVRIVLGLFWTFGSAVFITYPALFSFVAESSHERLQGAAFGVIFGFQLLGGSLASFAAGTLAEGLRSVADLESTAPFYLLGVLALAGLLYLVAIRGRVHETGPKGAPPLTTV